LADDFDLDFDLGFTFDFDRGIDLGFAFDLGFGFEAWRAVFFGRPAFTPLSLVGPAAPAGTIKVRSEADFPKELYQTGSRLHQLFLPLRRAMWAFGHAVSTSSQSST
jgi:hypothetical protein